MPGSPLLADLLATLRARPRRSGVLTDFDGTLAPIVADPAGAVPLDGVPRLLEVLARRYELVAVLSGRPVEFLAGLLPQTVVLSGLYGLEVQRDGTRHDDPAAASWRDVVGEVAAEAERAAPAGVRVEAKGLSLTLHFRGRADIAGEVLDWADAAAGRSGLVARAAKMSVELHPPLPADKGTAAAGLTAGLEAVCFLGDDLGDLPVFDHLESLRARGVKTAAIAVRSEEAPAELLARADLVVDGPGGAVDVLRALAAP